MSFNFSGEALDRAQRAVQAAGLLREKVPIIAQVCAAANLDDVVVAVVEQNLVFGGVWPIPRSQVQERVAPLESSGWVLIFSPRVSTAHVAAQCEAFGRIAGERAASMRRWADRHAGAQ